MSQELFSDSKSTFQAMKRFGRNVSAVNDVRLNADRPAEKNFTWQCLNIFETEHANNNDDNNSS